MGTLLPLVAIAQCPPNCTFDNPTDNRTLLDLIKRVAKDVRDVAVPFAVVAIVVIGFKLVTAAASGKAEETTKARKILLWVIIGSAIIVGATVLVDVAINTMQSIRS